MMQGQILRPAMWINLLSNLYTCITDSENICITTFQGFTIFVFVKVWIHHGKESLKRGIFKSSIGSLNFNWNHFFQLSCTKTVKLFMKIYKTISKHKYLFIILQQCISICSFYNWMWLYCLTSSCIFMRIDDLM